MVPSATCKDGSQWRHTLEDFIFCRRMKIEERWEKSAITRQYLAIETCCNGYTPSNLKMFIVTNRYGRGRRYGKEQGWFEQLQYRHWF